MKNSTLFRVLFFTASLVLADVARANPTGWVDSVDANGVVTGWVVDYSNPAVPIGVDFYIDQLDGAHYAGRVERFEEFDRPDVWQAFNWPAAIHGFRFTIPNYSPGDTALSLSLRGNASHRVYAFGIGLNGSNLLLNGGGGNGVPPLTPALPDLPVSLTQPLPTDGKFQLAPNQAASVLWFPPGNPINGHIEGSFDHLEYWPNLSSRLRDNRGGLGLIASEIGFMAGATLQKFRAAELTVGIETPALTQAQDGTVLGNLEFWGQSPSGNWFCSIFNTCDSTPGRRNPNGVGWFRTRDDLSYTPDEILMDERIPGLIPGYDIPTILNTSIPWAQRKQQAYREPCASCPGFNPGVDRVTGLINDYVEYARVMKQRFFPGPSPRLSLFWVVHPGWDWGDEEWLDQINATYPDPTQFHNAILSLQSPRHRGTKILEQLVLALCADGHCVDTVYMDIEYVYSTSYALDVLRRNKAVLEANNVKFGISILDGCTEGDPPGCVINIYPDGTRLYKVDRGPGHNANALYEESVLNVISFMLTQGIIDRNTKIRVGSNNRRPMETGSQINENLTGSLAHTANRVINEYLNPQGFERSWRRNGLMATYFDNHSWTVEPGVKRRDPTVNFDWGIGSPMPAIGGDDFFARWEGQVWAPLSETYTFYTVSDDGVRLWVNDQLLIDNWSYHGPTEDAGAITLVRGQKYNIKLEYFEGGGGATIKLLWSSPSLAKQIIPEDRLFSDKANVFDFDDDGKTDIAVYRPSNGAWSIVSSSTGAQRSPFFGSSPEVPVPGDYDGDGNLDLAIWNTNNQHWYAINSSTGGTITPVWWGTSGDLPAPADYDGDGKTDMAVWNPSNGNWYIIYSSSGNVRVQQWGTNGDKPVPADYDGDGKADIAVWRPSDGTWYIRQSPDDSIRIQQWGWGGDKPVPADYDGDRKADITVWRWSDGNWYIRQSLTNTIREQQWGQNGDIPVPGDYDGDRKIDPAVWRPSDLHWYIIDSSTGGTRDPVWGQSGDIPVPSAYVR